MTWSVGYQITIVRNMTKTQERLNYLRKQIENECISYGELAELQGLAEHIPQDDVVLREWAGVCENCGYTNCPTLEGGWCNPF